MKTYFKGFSKQKRLGNTDLINGKDVCYFHSTLHIMFNSFMLFPPYLKLPEILVSKV
jgi:hypothetical protein